MTFKKWRDKGGESFRVDTRLGSESVQLEVHCRSESLSTSISNHHCMMSANTKVTKTKIALKQETYNLSDVKHDLYRDFGFVNLS